MRAMGQNSTEDELLNMVMEVDVDGNGTIDFPEFLNMMKKKANEVDEEADLREAFKIFDRNRDGYIDMKELKKVTAMLGTMLSQEEIEVRQKATRSFSKFQRGGALQVRWKGLGGRWQS